MLNNFMHIYSIVYHQLKIEKALYTKYSQQKVKNYEDFFATKPIKWVIDYKDQLNLNDDDEYLKRYYPITQQPVKFRQLLEYYKYHKDIPRMFFGLLADYATYFYERKKKYEYRKIKIMLGIPYEQSSISTQYEKLNEDIQVLNSITRTSEKSAKSILRELVKQQKSGDNLNIDETWLTMQQQPVPQVKSQSNKILKQLVIRNSQINKERLRLNIPQLLNGKLLVNNRNCPKQSPEHFNPKSSSQQNLNSSQEENEFQKFMKAKIITLSQKNKDKIQQIFSNKRSIDTGYENQNNNAITHAKHSSAHFITSTRSVSSEQLKTDQVRMSQIIMPNGNSQSQPKLFSYIKPVHKKSTSQMSLKTEFTPAKKDSKLIKIYSNNLSNKIKTQTRQSPERLKKFFKQSVLTLQNQNSSKKELIPQNLNNLTPFQQFKMMLESPHQQEKKKLKNFTDTVRMSTEQKQITKRSSITISQNNKIKTNLVLKK